MERLWIAVLVWCVMVAGLSRPATAEEPGGEPLRIDPIPVLGEDAPVILDGPAVEPAGDDVALLFGSGEPVGIPIDLPMAATDRIAGPAPMAATLSDRDYVVFDVLFLDRDNAAANQPIAVEGPFGPGPGGVVLTTRSLMPTTAPGVRLFVGRHGCDSTGWELGYWGCYGFFGDAVARRPGAAGAPGGLSVPGGLGTTVPGWNQVSAIRTAWSSNLNVVECNLLDTDISAACEPGSPWPQRRCASETETDLIGGLFWAGLEEQAALDVTYGNDAPTPYRVATSSNLFGGQLGVRRRRTWDRFSLEGWLKAGLGGAWLAQSAAPITSPLAPGVDYRHAREANDTGMGFLSSMNLTMAYRFSDAWGMRLGYNLAWLSGLALAENQFDFDATASAGTGVQHAGGMFLHGANVGLEGRW
ncbi:MAG: hypothetical protein ACKO40_03210 [Planctomycetaceae bacterium]